MSDANDPNSAQARYWNSPSGRKWIEHERQLDAAMAEMLDLLLAEAGIAEGDTVLDVGCGTGASTLRAAKACGPSGRVDGVDISRNLVERAGERAGLENVSNVSFTEGDAQTYAFPENRYDRLISRFGMMFFGSPAAAFVNLAKAVKPGHPMVFVAWAGVTKNPWFKIPNDIAVNRLGRPTPMDPKAPGPLAFQDLGYVTGLLAEAGLHEIEAREMPVDLTPLGDVNAVAAVASRVGPAARVMKEFDGTQSDATAIETGVAEVFSTYWNGNEVRVPAAVNLFRAISG